MFGLGKPLRTVLKDVLSDLIKDGSDSLRQVEALHVLRLLAFTAKGL
ncbi:MAG: hypothetical protein ACFE68_01465 [Candidatus Hodarchaeota archaeon]